MPRGWDRRTIAELHRSVSNTAALQQILTAMGWAKAYKYTYYKGNARF